MIAERYDILAIDTLKVLQSEVSQRAVGAVLTGFLLNDDTSCGLEREILHSYSHFIFSLTVVEVNIHIEDILLSWFQWQFLLELKLHSVVLLQFKSALYLLIHNVSL